MSKFKVDNEELKQELAWYIDSCTFKNVVTKNGKVKKKIQTRGKVSERLGMMIGRIANGLSTKGNWSGYTWREDFVSYAILIVLKYMHNFNPEESDNAHGYINMICSNAFLQYIQKEKHHSSIKQELYDKKDEFALDDSKTVDYRDLKNVMEINND